MDGKRYAKFILKDAAVGDIISINPQLQPMNVVSQPMFLYKYVGMCVVYTTDVV